jgi:DNA processing protein
VVVEAAGPPGDVTDDERRARMLLSRVVEPGDPDACALVAAHGAEALLARLADRSDPDDDAGKVAGWVERLRFSHRQRVDDDLHDLDARYVCPGDSEWPLQLGVLTRGVRTGGDRRGGAPFGLWVRGSGDLGALTRSGVAVVGARAATAYGEHVAGELAIGCAVAGWTVVSGGAYGIDASAHRGALAAERATVCILAGGVDRLYPAGHAPMLRRILERGCLVSEAAPGCAPSKSRFLVRNRLIAALTAGTVVVEAALRSGSLNTARWARDLGRVVMGVPGPVTSAASAGVHELLRSELALLVTAPDEVVEHLSPIGTGLAPRRQAPEQPRDRLGPVTRQVLDAVPLRQPATVASVARAAGLGQPEVTRRLAVLLADGWVDEPAPGRWQAVGVSDGTGTGTNP